MWCSRSVQWNLSNIAMIHQGGILTDLLERSLLERGRYKALNCIHYIGPRSLAVSERCTWLPSNSYCMVNDALAHLLLESRGREAPEGECNKEPMHS